jgi:hypothetical protein
MQPQVQAATLGPRAQQAEERQQPEARIVCAPIAKEKKNILQTINFFFLSMHRWERGQAGAGRGQVRGGGRRPARRCPLPRAPLPNFPSH